MGRYLIAALVGLMATHALAEQRTYPIVDTNQRRIFSDVGQLRSIPKPGQAFFGQDGFHQVHMPSYRDNGDGTVSDLVTGLMWQKTPEMNDLTTWEEAMQSAGACRLGGHSDWRVPTIKELYSLIDFNGCVTSQTPQPYIDTRYFDFRFGQTSRGERIIDAQYWSSTRYVGTTMDGNPTVFGVNFADGRIKGYPIGGGRGPTKRAFVRLVRGNAQYGINRFVDNGDGTISDLATGLMWTRADSGKALNWQEALAWCGGLKVAEYRDWRLPDAKELQSIVDYTRRLPATDPMFKTTDGEAWFWSSTTHLDGPRLGDRAVYIAFGPATGLMRDRRTGERHLWDVHGAGAQRSDPKSGDPADPRFAAGQGPQGDVQRIYNFARAVRNIDVEEVKVVTPDLTPLPHRFAPPNDMQQPMGPPPEGTERRRRR